VNIDVNDVPELIAENDFLLKKLMYVSGKLGVHYTDSRFEHEMSDLVSSREELYLLNEDKRKTLEKIRDDLRLPGGNIGLVSLASGRQRIIDKVRSLLAADAEVTAVLVVEK
jgi:hypothetical protein